MQPGMTGLGRMGISLVKRLAKDDHRCVVNPAAAKKISGRDVVRRSRGDRLLSAMRKQFGGHDEKKEEH